MMLHHSTTYGWGTPKSLPNPAPSDGSQRAPLDIALASGVQALYGFFAETRGLRRGGDSPLCHCSCRRFRMELARPADHRPQRSQRRQHLAADRARARRAHRRHRPAAAKAHERARLRRRAHSRDRLHHAHAFCRRRQQTSRCYSLPRSAWRADATPCPIARCGSSVTPTTVMSRWWTRSPPATPSSLPAPTVSPISCWRVTSRRPRPT